MAYNTTALVLGLQSDNKGFYSEESGAGCRLVLACAHQVDSRDTEHFRGNCYIPGAAGQRSVARVS